MHPSNHFGPAFGRVYGRSPVNRSIWARFMKACVWSGYVDSLMYGFQFLRLNQFRQCGRYISWLLRPKSSVHSIPLVFDGISPRVCMYSVNVCSMEQFGGSNISWEGCNPHYNESCGTHICEHKNNNFIDYPRIGCPVLCHWQRQGHWGISRWNFDRETPPMQTSISGTHSIYTEWRSWDRWY